MMCSMCSFFFDVRATVGNLPGSFCWCFLAHSAIQRTGKSLHTIQATRPLPRGYFSSTTPAGYSVKH